VGAGVVPFALGTDTGGSVRVPAAFCGVYGFRTTPGHEWIRDAFPLSPTCDTAGWFTANPGDLRTVIDALLGKGISPRHETAGQALTWSRGALAPVNDRNAARAPHLQEVPGPSERTNENSLRGCFLTCADLGVEPDADFARAGTAMAARFAPPADDATRDALRAAWTDAVDTYATVVMHEAHAIHRDWLAPFRENYDPVIWQRISDGGRVPAEQLAQARENLGSVRESWRQFFATHDFLVLPCAPFPALRKADCTPEARRALLRLTAPASLGGLPVLTVPVPLAGGLTGGLQIVAREAASPVFDRVLRELE
ncbi:MAG: hypothetical protein HY302_14545, partial [Opitutae bacterium]|nr:hypothetical protein [Opitutae bacterium]